MTEQHRLRRDHKQLASRAAGTHIKLHCDDCGGRLVAELTYLYQTHDPTSRCVELSVLGPLTNWNAEHGTSINGYQFIRDLETQEVSRFTPTDAIEYAAIYHRSEAVSSSSVINDAGTAMPNTEPEQPTLDDEALIAQAILACANQIITAIDQAADQAFHHRRGRRDLAQVRILNTTGAMLQQLARDRGLQIARSQGASQANVARALGVTRARVNQMLKSAG